MSTGDRKQQAEQILSRLQRHPRVEYQSLAAGDEGVARMRQSMPHLVPFVEGDYRGLMPVLDWDHRLPSKTVILRIYAYYSEETLRAGVSELNTRLAQIESQDKFPEFDVPDFSGLTADEAYEGEVDPSGEIARVRLVSGWRRDIDADASRSAVRVAKSSEQFRELVAESRARPDYLGDLEAVSWTPPCESEYDSWTIDCWYLMYLDASVGKGRSFLVDPDLEAVVGVREFVVRSG
ncbi:MAG: hypothetical protein KC503_13710 [Myxococcales bacterium]|nr:hypothetical protein [Myxococcales bacterium]